jgi:hypothetical protein
MEGGGELAVIRPVERKINRNKWPLKPPCMQIAFSERRESLLSSMNLKTAFPLESRKHFFPYRELQNFTCELRTTLR